MIATWMLWATSGAHSRTGVISTIEKHSSLPPGLEWAPCTPCVLSKTPLGENCTQRDELPNICYTGSVTAMSNRDGIKEQYHVEADPSANRERRTWRRRNSQRAENCLLVLYC